MDFADADFIDLAPVKKAVAPSCAIRFATISLRSGAERVSLSFDAETIARLEGWPRFAIAWSAKRQAFRIMADPAGAFEAYKTQKGSRYVLRVALPAELRHVAGAKEPAPHHFAGDGRTLFVLAPPCFQRPARAALPAPAAVKPGFPAPKNAMSIVPASRVGR
jgi:hypothetical protein